MRILIEGGRLIDPAGDVDRNQDLYIADGKIVASGRKPADFEPDTTINASGKIVCPGLVDLRGSLREPGAENKGTIASETRAAVKGGITSLCCPPDTSPVVDTPAVVELIYRKAKQTGSCKVYPLGALTVGLGGTQLSEMSALQKAGCVGISNGLHPITTQIMRQAMSYAASHGLTVFIHPQDYDLSNGGCAHEGAVSTRLGLVGIPEAAETVAISQALQLIELTGVSTHFCQVSTATGAALIARAQYEGVPITADVTAHHLFLTDMDIGYFNSHCHVQPPLRSARDKDALRDALANGTISAICSDHQPHDVDAKLAPFAQTDPGISGLETLLPLALRLVQEEILSLPDAIARISLFPANILGINAGTLEKGSPADVCIFDPERYWQLSEQNMVSFGKNSPFLAWDFKGLVTHTLVNGHIAYEVDELLMLPIPEVVARESIQTIPQTEQTDDATDELLDLMDGEDWDESQSPISVEEDDDDDAPFIFVDDDEDEETANELLARKEPSANGEPSAGEEPSANRKPSANGEPSAGRKPSASEEPKEPAHMESVASLEQSLNQESSIVASNEELPDEEQSGPNHSVDTASAGQAQPSLAWPFDEPQGSSPAIQSVENSDDDNAPFVIVDDEEENETATNAMSIEPTNQNPPSEPAKMTASSEENMIVQSFSQPKLAEQRSKIESLISSAAKAMSETGQLDNSFQKQTTDTEGTGHNDDLHDDKEPTP